MISIDYPNYIRQKNSFMASNNVSSANIPEACGSFIGNYSAKNTVLAFTFHFGFNMTN